MQVLQSGIESRIDTLTQGLNNEMNNKLTNLLKFSKYNTTTIIDYIDSMRNEINPSTSYQIIFIKVLVFLSKFLNHKSYNEMTRDDIQLYLTVLAILTSITIIGMATIGTQQVYAPRNCGSCAEFKKLTHEFEQDVLDAATMGNPDTISGLLEQYSNDVRALDFSTP